MVYFYIRFLITGNSWHDFGVANAVKLKMAICYPVLEQGCNFNANQKM